VWYGPAVLAERPSERVKVTDGDGDERVIRVASSALDPRQHVCTVRYHVWRLVAQRVIAEVCEEHRIRFFFPLELDLLLQGAGLELIRLGGFPNLEDEPGTGSWNAGVVARAV
jgi:hypothetical protein